MFRTDAPCRRAILGARPRAESVVILPDGGRAADSTAGLGLLRHTVQ